MSDLANAHSSGTKALIKYVRRHFHDIYEVFQTNEITQRNTLLLDLTLKDLNRHHELLATHLSTRERLPLYPELYQKLFACTGKPKRILDLSCGLNPISFLYMHLPRTTTYIATELCADDCTFIEQYFNKIGLPHYVVRQIDLVREYEKLQEEEFAADICFLFKVLDICETQQRHITYKILSSIRAPIIIASFSLRNVKGEKMRRTKSHWFERMCRNLSYSFEALEMPGELFYIVRK